MKISGINISITGLILAVLYLIFAVFIFSKKTDGQGGVLKLFVTFPWFFIGMDKLPLWLGIIPNTIITYLMGYGIENLIKKIF